MTRHTAPLALLAAVAALAAACGTSTPQPDQMPEAELSERLAELEVDRSDSVAAQDDVEPELPSAADADSAGSSLDFDNVDDVDDGWVDGDAATPEDLPADQRTSNVAELVPDGALDAAARFAVASYSWDHDQPEAERAAALQAYTTGDATGQLVAAAERFDLLDDARSSLRETATATIGQLLPLEVHPDGSVQVQVEGRVHRTDVDGPYQHGFTMTMRLVEQADGRWLVASYVEA